jgi:hypothetical protein
MAIGLLTRIQKVPTRKQTQVYKLHDARKNKCFWNTSQMQTKADLNPIPRGWAGAKIHPYSVV